MHEAKFEAARAPLPEVWPPEWKPIFTMPFGKTLPAVVNGRVEMVQRVHDNVNDCYYKVDLDGSIKLLPERPAAWIDTEVVAPSKEEPKQIGTITDQSRFVGLGE